MAVGCPLICIGILFTNTFSLFVLVNSASMRRSTKLFYISLNVSGILIGISASIFLNSAFIGYWIFSDYFCYAVGYIVNISCSFNIYTMTLLSAERYMVISRPFMHQTVTTVANAICAVIILLFWSALISALPFVSLVGNLYQYRADSYTCGISYERSLPASLLSFALLILVSKISIVYFWCRILWVMHEHQQKRQSMFKRPKSDFTTRIKPIKTILLLSVGFYLSWYPFFIRTIYMASAYSKDSFWPDFYVIWLAFSNSLWNPLIFYWTDPKYKSQVKSSVVQIKLHLKKCCRQPNEMKKSSNEVDSLAPQQPNHIFNIL